MGFKDILFGVILVIIGAGLLFIAISMYFFSFGDWLTIIVAGILFIFGAALIIYGRNKTRGYR